MRTSLALLFLAACGSSTPIVPQHLERPELENPELLNGKFQNLRFDTPGLPMAIGASGFAGAPYQVTRDQNPSTGHTFTGKVWSDPSAARLGLPEGRTGSLGTRRLPAQLMVDLVCERPGTFEVKVALEAPGSAAVADAFDVVCATAVRLDSQAPRPGVLPRTIVGGAVSPSLLFYGAGEGEPLWGHPLVTVKPGEKLQPLGEYAFETTGPAHAPVLTALGLEYAVPAEVVDTDWAVALGPVVSAEGTLKVSAFAQDAMGPLEGLHGCTFMAKKNGVATALSSTWGDCVVTAYPEVAADWATLATADELCVTAQGQSRCSTLTH